MRKESLTEIDNLISRIKKEQKQVSIKRFLKRNLADVGMA